MLNQRAMEVLDDVGVARVMAERSTPAAQIAATAFYAGFAGPSEEYGRRLAKLECWGAGGPPRCRTRKPTWLVAWVSSSSAPSSRSSLR